MQKLLTIVVPVYKVEPYINKCLDSCLIYKTNGQGEKVLDGDLMNQLEVIIVNDGTPDRSAEMSREYVKRYPQTFRQIDKENGGHGSAWNVGLKEATGKYLRFLDSDDWFTNLDKLMCDLNNCDADVVMNSFDTYYAERNETQTTSPKPVEFGKQLELEKAMWGTSDKVNFWTITYKTSILKALHPLFAEKVMYDDYILTWVPLVFGRTYIAYDYVVYNYIVGRPNQSISVAIQEKRAKSYWSCFKQYEKIRDRIDESQIPDDLLDAIDGSIVGYAKYIFWYLAFFPYQESKSKLSYLFNRYLPGDTSSAVLRRYCKLPFFLFYWLEHLRNKKNKNNNNNNN